jgi:hypothetical protein
VSQTPNDQTVGNASTVEEPRQTAPACRGYCPGLRSGTPVLCEGACSNLAGWLLEAGWAMGRDRRGRSRLHPLLLVLAALVTLVGCRNALSAPADPAATGAKPYTLAVQPPASGKVNVPLVASIRVLPKGEYKINLEFPIKLKVSGSTAATPPQLELTAKQAARLTKAELLLKPTFKVSAPGSHAFTGTLRFSVCTEKQCEIKSETVKWTVSVSK